VLFDRAVLDIDCAVVSRQIEEALREVMVRQLRRRGVVLGISGGVDSAVCAVLAARALGPDRVVGLLMPERDFSPAGTKRAQALCKTIGIKHVLEDISSVLEKTGCYRRQDEAVQQVFPDYHSGCRFKIAVADNLLDCDRLNYFNLIVESLDGQQRKKRMPAEAYLQVVAATNMKQRTRKLFEYYHGERLNYAVLGAPNRLEYELGFFVRGGDGLADVKPIAHLYKTQVYALARYLGVPEEICSQVPSTDTYSLPQTQEEFYFAIPYGQMDLLLYAYTHGVTASEVGQVLGLSDRQVERAYQDIVTKQRVAARLNQAPILVDQAGEA